MPAAAMIEAMRSWAEALSNPLPARRKREFGTRARIAAQVEISGAFILAATLKAPKVMWLLASAGSGETSPISACGR